MTITNRLFAHSGVIIWSALFDTPAKMTTALSTIFVAPRELTVKSVPSVSGTPLTVRLVRDESDRET